MIYMEWSMRMREQICHVVMKPDDPLDPKRLRKTRLEAWRDVFGDELTISGLQRAANRACQMEGVRLCSFRVIPCGLSDRFEP